MWEKLPDTRSAAQGTGVAAMELSTETHDVKT